MKCKHQFFETNKESHIPNVNPYLDKKGNPMSMIMVPDKWGVRVICAICGEVRKVWQDGSIEIMKGGENG